ncbi:MAG: 16S rRNA (cytidine(1402)-2'-O)-methyltransferase [Defluviitaleaceae bacterium]|nr:16S rRNA (cytidine(1402)-2'-O)-methyltransferase [Defluviitaleaceae bacterium]
MNENKGQLYICATPIGNLEDITLRVLRVLKEVDLIAAEDTRHTLKLLNHYDIKTPMTSYHEHNEAGKAVQLVDKLLGGASIALVSDCGMPGISDPGHELIKGCHEAQIPVTVCPGASAGISALVMSGISARRYAFEGFLPREKKKRKDILGSLASEHRTIILYEAPHRLLVTLRELYEHLGERQVSIVREITKKFEEVRQGSLAEMIEYYDENPVKGEFVLIIEGAAKVPQDWPENIMLHVEHYVEAGLSEMDAMKKAAKDRGVAKSEVYRAYKGGGAG